MEIISFLLQELIANQIGILGLFSDHILKPKKFLSSVLVWEIKINFSNLSSLLHESQHISLNDKP